MKIGSLVALVFALNGAGCAQVKGAVTKEKLADRVALRIAEAEFVKAVLEHAKIKVQHLDTFIDHSTHLLT